MLFYLVKSGRLKNIQDTNVIQWKKSNESLAGLINQVSAEQRSISHEVQKVVLSQLLVDSTNSASGKVIEVGSYKGGTAVLFRRILDMKSDSRDVLAYDTFDGHPHVNPGIDTHKVSSFFQENSSETLGYLRENGVSYVVGDVMVTFDFNQNLDSIAFLHLDVDLYQVTKLFLLNLHRIMQSGGICVVDDFGKASCPGIELSFAETHSILNQHFHVFSPMTFQLVLIKK